MEEILIRFEDYTYLCGYKGIAYKIIGYRQKFWGFYNNVAMKSLWKIYWYSCSVEILSLPRN